MLKINFEPGEKIKMEMRKNWFAFIGPVFLFLLSVFVPIAVYILLEFFLDPSLSIPISRDALFILKFFVYPAWVLLSWSLLFVQWTNYYLDVWYVTDKRIIDVEQKSLFNREISNLRFDRIEDVSLEVSGIIANMLGFADIHVQTASEDSKNFVMKNANHPERVKRIVFSQHNVVGDKRYQ